ncbi:hypothetical protein TSTA_011980 [Talaromyces stipitatus ATCC 10500]|uniref:Amino acid permease/ SLC12A domain-containing protein n=1 Tax=Talaromyces stipitatus (strain ATCC 10500 / CBS 375.48 / QM 6759 / NRRL 1006) TaxID=441959 RepID=B8ME12_TALSN|nr:uncharacterized protein TSTA_011980 [Talaromyces stipitatus ATCC 10500]EED16089.1 hypothetical protein TSTA_011980 [Talaromyces stipitatus ATCC 10500]
MSSQNLFELFSWSHMDYGNGLNPGPEEQPQDGPEYRANRPGGSRLPEDFGRESDHPENLPWSLSRELGSIHIFVRYQLQVPTNETGHMLTLSSSFRLGGPSAAIYAYALLGVLATMVLHNIATMLRVWPVAGALLLYVKHFLDEEIGIVVTIVYWLTYCLTAAALTATIADLLAIFHLSDASTVVITVVVSVIPVALNYWSIRAFRHIEVGLGVFKLVVALVIILDMNILNAGTRSHILSVLTKTIKLIVYSSFQSNNPIARKAAGWFGGFMSSIFLGSFSIIGVEVVAVTAQEAIIYTRAEDNEETVTHEERQPRARSEEEFTDQFSWPARWTPIVVTLIYIWGVWSTMGNIPLEDLKMFYPNNNLAGSGHDPCKASIFIDTACPNPSGPGQSNDNLTHNQFGFYHHCSDLCFFENVKEQIRCTAKAIFVSAWLFWVPFLKFANAGTFNQVGYWNIRPFWLWK